MKSHKPMHLLLNTTVSCCLLKVRIVKPAEMATANTNYGHTQVRDNSVRSGIGLVDHLDWTAGLQTVVYNFTIILWKWIN
jgi:hypothetical protein